MGSLSRPFENILITEVEDSPFFVDELFQQKFGDSAPVYGYSVICFYRNSWNHFIPVCYANFLPHEGVILIGGAMTDGRAFGFMPEDLSGKIKESGGIYYHLLKFAFDRYKDQCEAYFGYAGNERAYEVEMQAGSEPTKHQHLIAHFHKPLTAERRSYLIEMVHSIGVF